MSETTTKLSDLVPARTAGELPSSRTYQQQLDAMASDDINSVKAQLAHVWAHYQSLEFLLSGVAHNKETISLALNDEDVENDISELDLALGFFAVGAVGIAYHMAHESMGIAQLFFGGDVQAALRELYPYLDYTDPAKIEVVDTDAIDL